MKGSSGGFKRESDMIIIASVGWKFSELYPANLRVIITALQIIQPGLYIVGLAMGYNVVLEDALLK